MSDSSPRVRITKSRLYQSCGKSDLWLPLVCLHALDAVVTKQQASQHVAGLVDMNRQV